MVSAGSASKVTSTRAPCLRATSSPLGSECIFDADLAEQIVRRGDGDLRLFGQAGDSRLYNFVHDRGHGLPRAIVLPDEFGMILKTAFLFAADEFAEFAELAGKLVVVFFLLDLGAEHVHTFTFFGSH